MSDKSCLMKLFVKLGFETLAWSLRRLHVPVKANDLVLEVGSGGNPYFRSNVLLDAYEVTRERHFAPLIQDRPTVLGFVEHLPFHNDTFDFVIASHVLEHSTDPEKFLSELQRVAKAGYIEVPDTFMERINPYLDHRLEITVRNDGLVIRKKSNWCVDPELVELYENRAKQIFSKETIHRHPFDFHVRYYWNKKIDFTIVNPDVDASWKAPESKRKNNGRNSFKSRINRTVLKTARRLLSQRCRNSKINLKDLLICPNCHSKNLSISRINIYCMECEVSYPVNNGLPVMYPSCTVKPDQYICNS